MCTATPYEPAQPRRATVGLIFFVVLLDVLGATILFPVAAYLVRAYSDEALAVGALSAIYAAAQFLTTPALGRLSDRFGRRPVLLLGLVGSAFGYALFGIGGALWVLFLGRLIDGLTGINLSVAQAYLADITPPAERSGRYALLGAAFGLGFILGPALGGAFSTLGLAAPAFAAAMLSLLSAVLGFFVLPESLPFERRIHMPFHVRELNPFGAIADLARRVEVGTLLLASVAFNLAFSGMTAIITVFVIERFAAQPLDIAALFTVGGVISVVTQAGFVYRMAPRLGERRLAIAGLSMLLIGYISVPLAPALWTLYPITALSWVGNALVLPTLTALVANRVAEQEQGTAAGVNTALTSLTSAIGPIAAGVAYDQVAPQAPYWACAVCVAYAAFLIARQRDTAVRDA